MTRIADLAGQFLRRQVLAGASAVQVFDSWAGTLSRPDYEASVRPFTRRVFEHIADLPVPRIHFGVVTGELLSAMALPECDVVGVDFRVTLADGIDRIGASHSVQGNLDPAAVLSGWQVTQQRAAQVIRQGAAARGHIFNLGHGVLPDTDPQVLTDLVSWIHEESPALRARNSSPDTPGMGQ
jgi:uroporphyrinogen decarboxylase